MLTPRIDDVNRKEILKQQKEHPELFSSGHIRGIPADWRPSGLVTPDGKRLDTDPRKKK